MDAVHDYAIAVPKAGMHASLNTLSLARTALFALWFISVSHTRMPYSDEESNHFRRSHGHQRDIASIIFLFALPSNIGKRIGINANLTGVAIRVRMAFECLNAHSNAHTLFECVFAFAFAFECECKRFTFAFDCHFKTFDIRWFKCFVECVSNARQVDT